MYVITNTSQEFPVELYDVKAHLRIDHDLDDYYLNDLIKASVLLVEHKTNRKVMHSTAQGYHPCIKGCVFLPYGNSVVVGVTANGNPLTSPRDYIAGAERIVFNKQQTDVVIDFDCGWTYDHTPADIRHALLMIIGTMYESRLDVTAGYQTYKAQFSSDCLLQHYKIY